MTSRTSKSKTAASPDVLTQVEARLATLEAQMAAMMARPTGESAATAPSSSPEAVGSAAPSQRLANAPLRKFWAIDGVLRRAEVDHNEAGGVVFAGQVVLPNNETYAWQIETDTGKLLAADWSAANAALAALAHPIRLLLLKALLEGKRDTQSLVHLPDMGTTGQLYHHLKELEAAGWIRQPRRGEYIVLAERVIPLLAILSACEVTRR
jgi:DNA-binding transcriptional ArsR family regulator